jgi:hypothetical protein
MNDDAIGRALGARPDSAPPDGALIDAAIARGTRRRRRRVWMASGVTAFVLTGGGLALVSANDDPETVVGVPPASAEPPGTDLVTASSPAPAIATSDAPDSTRVPASSGGSSNTTSTTTASTTSTTTTTEPPPTTSTSSTAQTTTLAIANTEPTQTTTVLTVEQLVLRSDGIGTIDFGTSEAGALAVLSTALRFATESTNTYPIALGDGTFADEFDDAFAYPVAHEVCFENALCVYFGGPDPGSLAFVGWQQLAADGGSSLATAEGVTAGSIWADHLDDIVLEPFSCYTAGYGRIGEIQVTLYSSDEPFNAFDDDGNPVETNPDPADVTVFEMTAGRRPYFRFDDC